MTSLFTNYPKWAVARFGVTPDQSRTLLSHGLVGRVTWQLQDFKICKFPEAVLSKWFALWARKQVLQETWDVVHSFSGWAEELLAGLKERQIRSFLVRGSSHIRTQSRILEE